jgi:hypothetical protein
MPHLTLLIPEEGSINMPDLARELREAASRGYFYNHSSLVMEAAAELKRKDAEIAKLNEECQASMGEIESLRAEIVKLRAAHEEIIRKYERIMGDAPEWTSFTPDDPRLKFAREAWFGAAQIARKAIGNEQSMPKGPAGDAGQVGWMGGEFDR